MVTSTKMALNEAVESTCYYHFWLKKKAQPMFQKVKYLFLPYERTKLCGSF